MGSDSGAVGRERERKTTQHGTYKTIYVRTVTIKCWLESDSRQAGWKSPNFIVLWKTFIKFNKRG